MIHNVSDIISPLEAHHTWKEGGHTFSSAELLEWLIDTVMPLATRLEEERRLPSEPTVEGRCLPVLPKLGTRSDLGIGCVGTEGEEMKSFKERCLKEYARRVVDGEVDVLSEMQTLIPPKRNQNMVEFELEMWFGHPTNDWYRGKVVEIVNGKTDRVKIKWDEKGLHPDDPTETVQKLTNIKYNPKTTSERAWRQFFKI